MLSIKQCRAILEKNGRKYTDEEVKALRELLYKMGKVDYLTFKSKVRHEPEGDHLFPGFDR